MGIQHGNERLDRKEVGYKEVKICLLSFPCLLLVSIVRFSFHYLPLHCSAYV